MIIVPASTSYPITLTSSLATWPKKGIVCLDGSPPAYHYAPGSGEGACNWMVYLEGGGWCQSKDICYSKIIDTKAPGCGSSSCKGNVTTFSGILSESQTTNPDFYNWNRVFVRYCDGSSFSGDVEEVIPVKDKNIHRRGARVFAAVMEEMLAMGMKDATNAILAGNSAGGLATMLHCDEFQALLPFAARLKCIADAGLFIRGKDLPGAVEKRERPFADIVAFHGIEKVLPILCTWTMDPSLCIFPENLLGYIETPIFLVNSAFDKYQISYLLEPVEPGWKKCTNDIKLCTDTQIQAMKDFRTTFLQILPEIVTPSRGMFIDSCYIHDQIAYPRWNGISLDNKTMAAAVGDWYFDRCSFQEIDMIHDSPVNCTL
ncbi:hypothetical protein ACJIZ3_023243 [Penstemon smallii]|uniref:Pectin acetylesterase n=1 Tax=Penstemon smallii TaxID=265156 RepID=A0ABD3TNK5_9LAMI